MTTNSPIIERAKRNREEEMKFQGENLPFSFYLFSLVTRKSFSALLNDVEYEERGRIAQSNNFIALV
jgi:hypothetical protein